MRLCERPCQPECRECMGGFDYGISFQLLNSALEVGHELLELGQLAKHGGRAQPVAVGDCRIAGDERPGVDRVGDAGLRRGNHALADRDVAGHADLPGQRHVVFNRHTARHADLRRQQHVAADGDAVRDLHEVVDLGAGADARLANGGTIDGRVGADLDVVFDDDAADLRNLVVACHRGAARSRSRRCR